VGCWANELWHRRDELPPELWKELAKIDRRSYAPGTANVGRWITAAALWSLTTPERGKLTPRNWPAFHEYFVVEFARLVGSGAVTEFKNRPAQGTQFRPEWNHLVETGEFSPEEGQGRISAIGRQVNRGFRSRFGETLP
jgi:hypothetical protein